ncbi:hypothetical protein [Ruminococcus sp.]|uniref:hypothetical protein n=1 Tax=Ruminococcus sp. TaxID=41978 RepID=UPI0025FFC37D|nr:hypothetical protein [Ruminococcus sp.]
MQPNSYWQLPESQHHYDVRALIFGAVSFLFCQLPLIPVGMGIAAIVYAAKARKQPYSSRHITIIGMVLGIIGVCVGFVATIYWVICFLGILMMLYQESDLVPTPVDPDVYEFENPGQPALFWLRNLL